MESREERTAEVNDVSGNENDGNEDKSDAKRHHVNVRQSRPQLQRQTSLNLRSNLSQLSQRSSRHLQLVRRQSSRLLESLGQLRSTTLSMPTSPTNWALLATSLASAILQYELQLQKSLTAPPIVFFQGGMNGRMQRLYQKMMSSNNGSHQGSSDSENNEDDTSNDGKEGILSRAVTPSLFVGTRGLASSTAAYVLGHNSDDDNVVRFREVMLMGADAAHIALDWEVPINAFDSFPTSPSFDSSPTSPASNSASPAQFVRNQILSKQRVITKPIVLLVHGLNNDSSFGYIRSMMQTSTKRGWIAAAINLRGQGGCPNRTPRGYTAAYTGDIRGVVLQLERRLKRKDGKVGDYAYAGIDSANQEISQNINQEDVYIGGPIFLVGYSLGANLISKYIGEESLHGTLPQCIGGGAALGNPLHIHSKTVAFPWNVVLGAGVKRSILSNLRSFKPMMKGSPDFYHSIKKALTSWTIGALDESVAPFLLRNENVPPFSPKVGYPPKSPQLPTKIHNQFSQANSQETIPSYGESYWNDASSHQYVRHVSIPLLQISAQDDFLVFGQFLKKMHYCLNNPNIMIIKTRCGGHLGWQERVPDNNAGIWGNSASWSDVAVADFIEALLLIRQEDKTILRSRL